MPSQVTLRARSLRHNLTTPEIRLWNILRGKQLKVKFRKQHPISPYIVDFYCFEKNLIIELDGITHDGEINQRYDRKRENYLKERGYKVLRFTNEDVMKNLEGVVTVIIETVSPPSQPPPLS